jgi:hypothetical protein
MTILSFAMGLAPLAFGADAGQAAMPPCFGGDMSAIGTEGLSSPNDSTAVGGFPSSGAGGAGPVGAGGATVAPGGTSGLATLPDFPGSTIELCPGEPVVSLPLDSFAKCEINACNMAHCVPVAAIPASVPLELLGRCADPTTVCVPDDYTATFGKFLPKSCESLLGEEGRCISTCVPQVNGLMDFLPKDTCGDNEVCAPCINPNDGSETGACSQGCDPGPSVETATEPLIFQTCQNGEGRCAPKALVPPILASHLIQYDCPSVDDVCAPIEKAQNLKYNFTACAPEGFSALGLPNADGQLGGCVPAWLADGNPFEGIWMGQSTCAAGEKCAPCHNPLRPDPSDPSGQTPTGACPVPLPSDPSGGLAPASGSPAAGTGGAPATSTGATPSTGGAPTP